jgi:RNA polymerase sigma factor (sigma-70 family)
MISVVEAQNLMDRYLSLKNIATQTKQEKDIQDFKIHEQLCIDKFFYLVSMRTDRYRNFHNYEDLNQEGLEALIKAMRNYNPLKGLFFWWGHKYIATRIARSANLHTTIRYPLRYTRITTPKREPLPIMIEKRFQPDKNFEETETVDIIDTAMNILGQPEKNVLTLLFGLDGDKPLSINKVCKQMNMPRSKCIKIIDNALSILGQNIKL